MVGRAAMHACTVIACLVAKCALSGSLKSASGDLADLTIVDEFTQIIRNGNHLYDDYALPSW